MKNMIGAVVTVVAIVLVVTGTTFAWYTWSSDSGDDTNVTFTISGVDSQCITYSTSNSGSSTLIPVSAKESGYLTTVTISQTCGTDLYADFTLTPSVLPDNLKNASFKYAFVHDSTTTTGDFSAANVNTPITLAEGVEVTSSSKALTLYLWIDGNMSNPSTMQSQSYNFILNANATNEVMG